MNKKITFILTALMLLGIRGIPISAQDFSLSAGGGLTIGNSFYSERSKTSSYSYKRNELGIGSFGFFDATYAELNVGYKFEFMFGDGEGDYEEAIRGSINIGLLGKYPFDMGYFALYPLLGVQYMIVMSYDDDFEDLSDFNALWIMAGGGGDYLFSDALFLRGQFLWGFKMNNEREKSYSYASTYLTHGPSIKIALGYRFW